MTSASTTTRHLERQRNSLRPLVTRASAASSTDGVDERHAQAPGHPSTTSVVEQWRKTPRGRTRLAGRVEAQGSRTRAALMMTYRRGATPLAAAMFCPAELFTAPADRVRASLRKRGSVFAGRRATRRMPSRPADRRVTSGFIHYDEFFCDSLTSRLRSLRRGHVVDLADVGETTEPPLQETITTERCHVFGVCDFFIL